mmetsp:Transcript_9650/g.10686  ORF Transcript_9650/g.10686 Transcript_9650/m.10686 type:complete len:237 (+) Transcript_9650:24-734(+)
MQAVHASQITAKQKADQVTLAIRDKENFERLKTKADEKLKRAEAAQDRPAPKVATKVQHFLDNDTTDRVMRANKKMCECLHNLANEPSIGLYHITDHIRRNVPKLVTMKQHMKKETTVVNDFNYDLEYTMASIKSLGQITTFDSIKNLVSSSIESVQKMNRGEAATKKEEPTENLTSASAPFLAERKRSLSEVPKYQPPESPATTADIVPVGNEEEQKDLAVDEEEEGDIEFKTFE